MANEKDTGEFACPHDGELVDTDYCESFLSAVSIQEELKRDGMKSGCKNIDICKAYLKHKKIEVVE